MKPVFLTSWERLKKLVSTLEDGDPHSTTLLKITQHVLGQIPWRCKICDHWNQLNAGKKCNGCFSLDGRP